MYTYIYIYTYSRRFSRPACRRCRGREKPRVGRLKYSVTQIHTYFCPLVSIEPFSRTEWLGLGDFCRHSNPWFSCRSMQSVSRGSTSMRRLDPWASDLGNHTSSRYHFLLDLGPAFWSLRHLDNGGRLCRLTLRHVRSRRIAARSVARHGAAPRGAERRCAARRGAARRGMARHNVLHAQGGLGQYVVSCMLCHTCIISSIQFHVSYRALQCLVIMCHTMPFSAQSCLKCVVLLPPPPSPILCTGLYWIIRCHTGL